MTKLKDKNDAFPHVIDSHRWLAASGCAWNLVGPGGTQNRRFDQDLPDIVVMIRDCLLLHARSLIKFYKGSSGQDTDIVLGDFDIPRIPSNLRKSLDHYEHPIEIHLFHLTDYRDPDYRRNHPTTGRKKTSYRPDWNQDTAKVAELILKCLKYASEQSGKWQAPFTILYDATAARYRDKSHKWPKELC